ncbi:MAG: leucyl/phenylalanyl-tRNA--protein transferase [Candidatus Thioglobus sp.]|nr:MAG: leucyl/phenylalanyl-tRNA--protein transferase [Candidatus Thioglobus sp.]
MSLNIPESFFIRSKDDTFPDVSAALDEPNGLLAIGGDLSPERLISAYKQGIFPWYSEGEPVLWYSPNPRMVINKDALHISKNLAKLLRFRHFTIKVNSNFEQVIYQCKTAVRKGQNSTWIDEDMLSAYTELHALGVAQSVEVYRQSELVGGLYGVHFGKMFFGESMFSKTSGASKIALVHLVQNMGYELIDCQVESPHLKSLGAFNIERTAFIEKMQKLLLK